MGGVLCKLCGALCTRICCDPCGGGCLSRKVPWLPSHLTPKVITAWLQKSGGLESDNFVQSLELKSFAIGEGLMSIMYRVAVKYKYPPKAALKNTFVCKLSPPAAKPRFIGDLLSLFKTEVNFYNKGLRETTGMDAPICYFAGVASNGRYCILLEDLSPSKAGNQIQGVTIQNARDATRCLAKLHSKYQGKVRSDPTFDDWLLLQDDREYWNLVKGSYSGKSVSCCMISVFSFFLVFSALSSEYTMTARYCNTDSSIIFSFISSSKCYHTSFSFEL